MGDRIEELVGKMTLEEKVRVVAGADHWHTQTIERLGIPAIKMTDGPHGARGGEGKRSPTSVCFPVGTAMAATWNTALIERVGVALGEETQAKGAHILLGPTVNIHRSPLAGRNFECYSEDPYLTQRIAVAWIKGIQSQGVGACIKHYVCNDSEFERRSLSSEVGERALREIYLPPFKAAVKEARVWTVMAAYNRINGVYASANPYTLNEVLKGEWGFRGFVVSDWRVTASTVPTANGGLDLEMPGPPLFMGDKLLKAVQEGFVSEQVLDDKVRRILGVVAQAGAFENPKETPEKAVDKAEHRKLARETACEGIVLLKNENNALPLKVKSLAMIGPNANVARIMGGGSSWVNPHYAITPLEGITNKCGDSVQVHYQPGCTNHKLIPATDVKCLNPAGGQKGRGLYGEYFKNLNLSGAPVLTEVSNVDFAWRGRFPLLVNQDEFSARWTGTFTAPETDVYVFSLTSDGASRLYVEDELVIDNWTEQPNSGDYELTSRLDMVAGQSYAIKIEYSRRGASPGGGLRQGCMRLLPDDAIARATQAAAECDAALVFVGTSNEWESEGFDRVDMELPGEQVELVKKVAAANANTIVVLNTGSPVTMSQWIDQVPAVLQAWFPGQECGNAIADVLFGDVNPSGKLPTTFPKRLEDNPAYINYPGESGKVFYGEGIFVGYRYYDKKKIEPLFPFGHGLSYTRFEYGNLEVKAEAEVEVEVEVKNSGEREGQEVVQLYVRDVESSLVRPEKELKAFAKITLKPGETKIVRFTLGQDALAYYDPRRRQWIAEAGEFEALIGSSSRDIRARGSFELKTTLRTPHRDSSLSIDSALWEILDDEKGKAVLLKHLGHLVEHVPQFDSSAMELSLNQLAQLSPDVFTPEMLRSIDADLQL
ncbi:MAG: glycoside hydrolase family 3 C-terminal domain-containing protein [Anaerolineae bacterium]|jgi:beta-glucosidase